LSGLDRTAVTDPSRDRKGLEEKYALDLPPRFRSIAAHRSLDGLVTDGGRRIIESSGRHVLRVGNTTPVAEAGESNVLESGRCVPSLGSDRGGGQVSSGRRLHFAASVRRTRRRSVKREKKKRTCGWVGSVIEAALLFNLWLLGNRGPGFGRTAQRQKGARVGDVPAFGRQNAGL
jgi:hypothetical protein